MDAAGILLHLSPSKHLGERPLRCDTSPKNAAENAYGEHYNPLFAKYLQKSLNKVWISSAKWSGASSLNANRDRANGVQASHNAPKWTFPRSRIVRDKCKKNGLASIGIGTSAFTLAKWFTTEPPNS